MRCNLIIHMMASIIGTWCVLSGPLLLIIFSIELVLSTFLRWLECAIRHNHSKNMGGGAKLDVRA